MPTPELLTNTVSANGQVVLPKSFRRALRWDAGTRLVVENAPGGVMLRQAPAFVETRSGTFSGALLMMGLQGLWRRWKQAGVLAKAGRFQSGDGQQCGHSKPDWRRPEAGRPGRVRD